MSKSKVLSVRLSLEALQSCFDLCEALGNPTNGASGAISRSIEILTKDLREKGTLPNYTKNELSILVESFIAKKNPTSMMNLESLSNFNPCNGVVSGRSFSGLPQGNTERILLRTEQRNLDNSDFSPSLEKIEREMNLPIERSFDEVHQDAKEYESLIEEQILEQMKIDENDLLARITR